MAVEFICPHCGKQTLVSDEFVGCSGPCAGCGKTVTIKDPVNPFAGDLVSAPQPAYVAPDMSQDPAMRVLFPVGRSPWAIAAGYAGLFAGLFFPAPIALALGIFAVRDIKKHPEKHGMGRAVFAIVMGAIFSIVLIVATIGIAVGG